MKIKNIAIMNSYIFARYDIAVLTPINLEDDQQAELYDFMMAASQDDSLKC